MIQLQPWWSWGFIVREKVRNYWLCILNNGSINISHSARTKLSDACYWIELSWVEYKKLCTMDCILLLLFISLGNASKKPTLSLIFCSHADGLWWTGQPQCVYKSALMKCRKVSIKTCHRYQTPPVRENIRLGSGTYGYFPSNCLRKQ